MCQPRSGWDKFLPVWLSWFPTSGNFGRVQHIGIAALAALELIWPRGPMAGLPCAFRSRPMEARIVDLAQI